MKSLVGSGLSTRSYVLVLVALAFVFTHLFTIAIRPSFFAASTEVQHALLHWQGQAHHHHEDGSISVDHSQDSIKHVSFDGCLMVIALSTDIFVEDCAPDAARPVSHDERARPWPYLDGPMHPPRFTA